MPKHASKPGTKRPIEKTESKEFTDPVVLTPVEVVPQVARDVALRTRELLRKMSGDTGTPPERPSSKAPRTSRTR